MRSLSNRYLYDPPAFDIIGYEAQVMIELSPDVNLYVQVGAQKGTDLRDLLDKAVASFNRTDAKPQKALEGNILK